MKKSAKKECQDLIKSFPLYII